MSLVSRMAGEVFASLAKQQYSVCLMLGRLRTCSSVTLVQEPS